MEEINGVSAEKLLSNYRENLEEMKEEYERLMTEKKNLQLEMDRRRTNITRLASDLKVLYRTAEEYELHRDCEDQNISQTKSRDFAKDATDLINQGENDDNLEDTVKSLKYTRSLLTRQCGNLAAQLRDMSAT